jgi:hypothetical protein
MRALLHPPDALLRVVPNGFLLELKSGIAGELPVGNPIALDAGSRSATGECEPAFYFYRGGVLGGFCVEIPAHKQTRV